MEGLSGKEQMLARIRHTLGVKSEPQFAPEPLPPFAWKSAEPGSGDLVLQFVTEAEKVGGVVTQVHTEGEVKEYLESLLPTNLDAPVALSDGEVLRRLGIREWLARSGRQVVPAQREFVAAALPPSVTPSIQSPDDEQFATLVEQYKHLLLSAAVGITTADFALADTGTLVIVSGAEQHRLISLLPPVHVCMLDPARILPSLTDLLTHLRDRFSESETAPKNMTCITGPSRTADIEQAITMGVHGPKSLHLILYSGEYLN